MAMRGLTPARLTVLPFAPTLWLYMWWVPTSARRLTRAWPRWLRVPLLGTLIAAGFVGILLAQADVYTRMTGIRVLANDSYFLGLFLVEIAIGLLLGVRLAYKEQRGERPGGTG